MGAGAGATVGALSTLFAKNKSLKELLKRTLIGGATGAVVGGGAGYAFGGPGDPSGLDMGDPPAPADPEPGGALPPAPAPEESGSPWLGGTLAGALPGLGPAIHGGIVGGRDGGILAGIGQGAAQGASSQAIHLGIIRALANKPGGRGKSLFLGPLASMLTSGAVAHAGHEIRN